MYNVTINTNGINEISIQFFSLLVVDKTTESKTVIHHNGKPTFMIIEINDIARIASKMVCTLLRILEEKNGLYFEYQVGNRKSP